MPARQAEACSVLNPQAKRFRGVKSGRPDVGHREPQTSPRPMRIAISTGMCDGANQLCHRDGREGAASAHAGGQWDWQRPGVAKYVHLWSADDEPADFDVGGDRLVEEDREAGCAFDDTLHVDACQVALDGGEHHAGGAECGPGHRRDRKFLGEAAVPAMVAMPLRLKAALPVT